MSTLTDPDAQYDARAEQQAIAAREEPPPELEGPEAEMRSHKLNATQEFRDRAIAVHHWRGELARLKADLAVEQAFFESEIAGLLRSIAEATAAMTGHEAALRELTLAAYRETGDKRPWEGVGIRVNRILHYEAEAALAWAKEHNLALALDVKAFAAIAKVQPLEFVRVEEEAQATISQNLGAVLEVSA